MRPLPGLLVAFLLGACASATVASVASAPSRASAEARADDDARAAAKRAATRAPAGPERRVLAAGEAPQRVAPNGKGVITLLARGDGAFLGHLEMAAGGAVPEHRDATEEYLYILEGGGDLTIDGEHHRIGPGSTVFMPANALVSFQNGDAPLVAIQVFAGPAPAAKYDAWTPREP